MFERMISPGEVISIDILAWRLDKMAVEDGIEIQGKTWPHKDDDEPPNDHVDLVLGEGIV